MKKLLVIAVVLSTLFLGGCVSPGFNMSGSIGFGGIPNGGYGVRYGEPTRAGDGVSVPVYNPFRGYMGNGYIENRCKYKNEATRWVKGCR